MAFDEQLRQAFETLTDRVREEVARELRGLTDDLVKQAAADRERAAAEAGDTARTEAERAAEARIAEAEDAALARVADAQRAADARLTEAESAAAKRLADAVAEAGSASAQLAPRPARESPPHPAGQEGAAPPAGPPATGRGLTAAPFNLPGGRERWAVPFRRGGRVVAVLYADQGPADDPQRNATMAWPATVEVMGRHAARCLEALTAFKAARVLTE